MIISVKSKFEILQYIYLVVLGMGPEAHDLWDVLCWVRISGEHGYFMFYVEQEAFENMSIYIGVEREALEHMTNETFLLRMMLLSTWKDKNGSVGHKPWSLPIWCWE